MTSEVAWHPDLLRRFVATPFVFCTDKEANRICIQSNDLEIALSVRRSCLAGRLSDSFSVLSWKLIRDASSPVESAKILTITDDPLRILYFGKGTILTHDRERAEVFGFISTQVKAEQLISSLLPVLLNIPS